MLHGVINEQGRYLNDNYIRKKNSLHFPSKSLVSGALILEIIFIDDCQTHAPLLQM